MLWHTLYIHTLKCLGFELDHYDMCVANKIVDSSKCTIAFYVDDNKISHRDPKVVDEIIEWIKKSSAMLHTQEESNMISLGWTSILEKTRPFLSI